MGKKCDLCSGVARVFCDSDQASLCWDCDGKVHGANFLVAKHTRCLLCSTCQSSTSWNATGLRLSPTFSLCESCLGLSSPNRVFTEINGSDREEDRIREVSGDGAESYDDDEEEEEDDYSDDDDDEDEVDDDEETENQVVPWSAAAQPPPVMSSSSSDGRSGILVAKRTRDYSDDEIGCSSAQESNYSRLLKRPSRDVPAFKSTAAVNSVLRLEGDGILDGDVDSSYYRISKTSRDLSR